MYLTLLTGIKPYRCKLCQATFTRLHSLKYHMMIHNQQSRFVCDHCSREFRHASHFREHLRRHTGEEPFGCTDCPARFKTRNTYKRHLFAKHGKLLTADGIQLVPTWFLKLIMVILIPVAYKKSPWHSRFLWFKTCCISVASIVIDTSYVKLHWLPGFMLSLGMACVVSKLLTIMPANSFIFCA